MRILVTGGAGYIGSVIVEELLRDQNEVWVVDNLSRGHRRAVEAAASFHEADISDRKTMDRILSENRIEAVIHMAASSLVGESVAKPREYYTNNVESSLVLLGAMCETGVKRIVFSSTAAVYGEPAGQPIEETDRTRPTNPYGETKLAFEKALEWYSSAYGIRYTSLRYFNAAGATERHGESHDPETHLIPASLLVAAGRKPWLEVFGQDYPTPDGTCVRDYIHVVDLARAHILALHSTSHQNAIYNLGCGGEGYSVKEVVDTASRVTGREIPVRIGPRRSGDPAVLVASSGRIRSELGWNPSYQSLSSMIESAWKWMQSHPDGYGK